MSSTFRSLPGLLGVHCQTALGVKSLPLQLSADLNLHHLLLVAKKRERPMPSLIITAAAHAQSKLFLQRNNFKSFIALRMTNRNIKRLKKGPSEGAIFRYVVVEVGTYVLTAIPSGNPHPGA